MTQPKHACVDCAALPPDERPKRPRPAPHGGPRSLRCTTHERARKQAQRLRTRERTSEKVYGLPPGFRATLLAFQGGECPICGRGLDQDKYGRWNATVHEHDHELAAAHEHPVEQACPECIRALTCAWCNRELLTRIDLEAARRLVAYYEDPPARRLARQLAEGARS